MAVYLIHFEQPYKHARHYLGFVEQPDGIQARVERHAKGGDARLLQVVTDAGIAWRVVRTWPDGDRSFERKLKNKKNSKCLCPVCRASGKVGMS